MLHSRWFYLGHEEWSIEDSSPLGVPCSSRTPEVHIGPGEMITLRLSQTHIYVDPQIVIPIDAEGLLSKNYGPYSHVHRAL